MREASEAQAERHMWLNHTLGLLKPAELRKLAERRGWAPADATIAGVASKIWSMDGLEGSWEGLPDDLRYAVHFMALNHVTLTLPEILRFFCGLQVRLYPWTIGELRRQFKALRAEWLPWGWLLTYS